MRPGLSLGLAILIASCHSGPASTPPPISTASPYLFVWAGDKDKQQSDFLAVIDIDPRSPTYAAVLKTVPVGATGTMAHHTEYEMPADGILWASGFMAGQTYLFDLRDPTSPSLLTSFGDVGPMSHPHSYSRLPNGHILATFQHKIGGGTGGLVEFDSMGRVVRTAEAAVPAIDSTIRPYSLAVLPALDRVVTTATDMHLSVRSRAVQVWRLSDLKLVQTILLPPGPRGDENWLTAEPRVLSDGRTVLVNTFTCGLYRIDGLASDSATATWVYSTQWSVDRIFCAVPVVAGRYARLTLGANEIPHWLGLEAGGDRVVITGYRELESRVVLAHVDRATGALSLDATFKSPGARRVGLDLGLVQWPHGPSGPAIPHGAVFSRP